MNSLEWYSCREPDLMLEHLMGKVPRADLVKFVRQCWERITPYLSQTPHDYTVVEQFEEIAEQLSDYDAAIYTSEAAQKAAGLSPNMAAEKRNQAELLRRIIGPSIFEE